MVQKKARQLRRALGTHSVRLTLSAQDPNAVKAVRGAALALGVLCCGCIQCVTVSTLLRLGLPDVTGLRLALTAGVMITSYITMARGDKRPPRALLEAIVANLIFGALLALRSLVSRR